MTGQHFLDPGDVILAAMRDHVRVQLEEVLGCHPDSLAYVVVIGHEHSNGLRHLAILPAPLVLAHSNA